MLVRRPADFAQEIREVTGLGEPGKLRHVVQANVYQSSDAGCAEALEKVLR
jgi:hypothetical protein